LLILVYIRRFLMNIITNLNSILWGTPMLVFMMSAGVFFSVGTGFFQLRHPLHCLKQTILSRHSCNDTDRHSVSQFQAMSSALAATLGTGNITGVSAALAAGGAGAVFWMWVSALFGMMTGYAENLLGIRYRQRTKDGEWRGGAMYYIRYGLEHTRARPLAKPLACIFAALCVLSAFGMGNLAQSNSAAAALCANFSVPPLVTGAALAVIVTLVICGGVKRVGAMSAKIVPLMSCFYIIGALWIMTANIARLPDVFGAIFEGAFGIDAVSGGISGHIIKQAVSMGFRRGVFSNEAGLGTSVAAHAASDIKDPCIQGMWSIFEVFFDTIIMCSLTAVILLASPCTAPTAEQAFSRISTQPQYFLLTSSESIITDGAPCLEAGQGESQQFRTMYATSFEYAVSDGSMTFSNIMTVTGIQSTDADGKPIFLDSAKTIPLIERVEINEVTGSELATYAFSQTFGSAAGKLLAVSVVLFAFSTIIGWSCFGSQAAVYIFGKRAEKPFRVLFILSTISGAALDFSAVWGVCDLVNGLMALPNLTALFILSPQVFSATDEYCRRVFGKKKKLHANSNER